MLEIYEPHGGSSVTTKSRSRKLRPALVTLVSAVVSVAGAGQAAEISDPLTRYGIAQFLIESSVNSVEGFVAGLPANHRRGFELSIDTSIHRYRDASTTAPWAVAKGSDNRFVFGWGTDPSRSGYDLVRWIARVDNEVHTGLIDFSGTSPRVSRSLGCLRCHARASGDDRSTEPVFRTAAADDSTRDTLLQTLSADRRIGVLEVAPLSPILQADWQPLDGIVWTNQWRGDESAGFELSANNTVDVAQFISKRRSDLEVRTGSNQIEEVEFAIARLGSHPTWVVATDQSAPWTLAGASGLSRGLSALHQTGQYWMRVRAFTTDEEGRRLASVPLDIAYKVENGDSPTVFGLRAPLNVPRGTGNSSSSSGNSASGIGTKASGTTLTPQTYSAPTPERAASTQQQSQNEGPTTYTVSYTWDGTKTNEQNNDALNQAIVDQNPGDHDGTYTVTITADSEGTVNLVFTPNTP